MTNIVNAVFQQRDTLNAHAEREAADFLRIVAAHLKHARMNHAAAENFEPARLLAHPAAFAAALHAGDVNLRAWLREREEAWTKPDLRLRAEHLLHELQQRSFQIAHPDVFADDEAFDLIELERMRRIVIIAAVYFARANDLNRRFAVHRLHRPNLNRRRMRAHQNVVRHVERILHVARRMVLRQIQALRSCSNPSSTSGPSAIV